MSAVCQNKLKYANSKSRAQPTSSPSRCRRSTLRTTSASSASTPAIPKVRIVMNMNATSRVLMLSIAELG